MKNNSVKSIQEEIFFSLQLFFSKEGLHNFIIHVNIAKDECPSYLHRWKVIDSKVRYSFDGTTGRVIKSEKKEEELPPSIIPEKHLVKSRLYLSNFLIRIL